MGKGGSKVRYNGTKPSGMAGHRALYERRYHD